MHTAILPGAGFDSINPGITNTGFRGPFHFVKLLVCRKNLTEAPGFTAWLSTPCRRSGTFRSDESFGILTHELQKKYADQGFKIASFADQNRHGIENFTKRKPVVYAIGLESGATFDRYGVTGIPQAFLLDKSGKITWEGNSGEAALDSALQVALKTK